MSVFLLLFYLQTIEHEMVSQVQKFEDLYETGQNIVQCVQNDEAVKKISSDLEAFQERWKKLVDNMEQQSKQVGVKSISSRTASYQRRYKNNTSVVPLFRTQHEKGKYWLFLKNYDRTKTVMDKFGMVILNVGSH